jgi:hypothetical protein
VWDPTTAASTATRFFYDGDRLVFETRDTGVPRHFYVHGNDPDQPLVWWDLTGSNNRRFLHADHQGSIVAVSRGENGAAFAINSYDPWGGPGANNAPTLRKHGSCHPEAAESFIRMMTEIFGQEVGMVTMGVLGKSMIEPGLPDSELMI